MIVTVTLNPALDHFIFLESFERGVIQRFSQDVFAPGGKGVNVSLLLSSLGVENRALGLARRLYRTGALPPAGRGRLPNGFRPAAPGEYPGECEAALRGRGGDRL